MRKLFLFLLLLPTLAVAQGARRDDIAWSNSNGSATIPNNVQIRVCTNAATGNPCSPTVSIFSNQALTTVLANPFTVTDGNVVFYAAPGRYQIQWFVNGATTASYTQSDIVLPSDPLAPTFTTVTVPQILAGGTNLSITLTPSGNGIVIAQNGLNVTGGSGNGSLDLPSTASGTVGPAGNVRYTACSNLACVSENAAAVAVLIKGGSATGAGTTGKILKWSGASTAVDSNIGDFDIAVNNAPRSMWSTYESGGTGSTYISAEHIFTKPFTLTRFTAFLRTQGAACTTYGAIDIFDSTAASSLATITLAASTSFFDSGVLSVAVVAGHDIRFRVKTANSGCGTSPSGIVYNMEFVSQ